MLVVPVSRRLRSREFCQRIASAIIRKFVPKQKDVKYRLCDV